MPKSSAFIDFAAVKAAVSLQQILDHYGVLATLTRSGTESLRGCCPIHQGVSPDQFSVTLSINAWKCFSECQHGGNQLDFVMRMESCTLHEAAWKVNEWFNLGLEKIAKPRLANSQRAKSASGDTDTNAGSRSKPSRLPIHEVVPEESEVEEAGENKPLGFSLQNLNCTHEYLTERKLTVDAVKEFGLGFCPKGIMAGRVVIPIQNRSGELVAYAGRWPAEPRDGKEKYRLPAGFKKSLELFNIHRALKEPPNSPLVIVEGFFDVIERWQTGERRVVALMGTHLSKAQEDMIRDALQPDDRLIVALDKDEAGQSATPAIVSRLARYAFVRAV